MPDACIRRNCHDNLSSGRELNDYQPGASKSYCEVESSVLRKTRDLITTDNDNTMTNTITMACDKHLNTQTEAQL